MEQQNTCSINEVGTATHRTIDEHGMAIDVAHVVDCCPNFHCEVNPIEMLGMDERGSTKKLRLLFRKPGSDSARSS